MSPEEVEQAESTKALLPTSLVLDRAATKSYLRMYKILRRGYSSLLTFTVLLLFYWSWIGGERDSSDLLAANAALANHAAIEDAANVQSLQQFWVWMRSSFVPAVFARRYELQAGTRGDSELEGDVMYGYRVTHYNFLVGGVLVSHTARKRIQCAHVSTTPSLMPTAITVPITGELRESSYRMLWDRRAWSGCRTSYSNISRPVDQRYTRAATAVRGERAHS